MSSTPASALDWISQYHRLTNYISASQLYLKDNYTLKEPLQSSHIKNRILGHWGTVPGLNLIYAGLNYIQSTNPHQIMHIVGPGHGAPSTLANLYVEGTLHEFYPHKYSLDSQGFAQIIHDFSWPGGFPSHAYPGTPGNLHEGGELGYSLGEAFGAVLDNPDLLVSCVVGDGEAETGTLAAAWHSTKFINPINDGAVLPILHLNGYKISGPTVFGSMSQTEIEAYFTGLGWEPLFVNQYTSSNIYKDFLDTLTSAVDKIDHLKKTWKLGQQPRWPVIILTSKKGWTGPRELKGQMVEDNNLSHGIPLKNPKYDTEELTILESWLKSYMIEELLDPQTGAPEPDVLAYLPKKTYMLGRSPYAIGGNLRQYLKLPNLQSFSQTVLTPGQSPQSELFESNTYLAELQRQNPHNFRVFSPDESESNMMEPLLQEGSRQFIWPVRSQDTYISPSGRMLELLSEPVLQTWMQGYNLTGRHGLFISYEAFLNIIVSQVDQYLKFLRKSKEILWRKPLPSLNYVATSTCWRQDHNGFSHQNPGFINTFLTQQDNQTRVYFPSDVNSYLVCLEECLQSTDRANLIVSGKTDLPQWQTLEQARAGLRNGLAVWDWTGNEHSNDESKVDVVLASAGDYQTLETIAAIQILSELVPTLKIRYVNIMTLDSLGIGGDSKRLEAYFTVDKPVIFNFHGYPNVIKQLVFNTSLASRIQILGYIEKGTTTTPFDMQVQNETSRFHVAKKAIQTALDTGLNLGNTGINALTWLDLKLAEHAEYIVEHGDDLPDVKNWVWSK